MARKSMKGGSPASRAVMRLVKTDSVRCNERFVAAANTHDVSNGDFYFPIWCVQETWTRRGRSRRGRGKGKGKSNGKRRETNQKGRS